MGKPKKESKTDKKASTIKHPSSRKALKLAKQISKEVTRNKSKINSVLKRNILGEKLLWFQEHLEPGVFVYTPQKFDELIQRYIARNDEELEQIRLKHSIGQRKNRQHASREDAIMMTKERELGEYNGPGIEMVNIMQPKMLEAFENWEGNYGSLNLLKVERFSKKSLESYKQPKEMVEKFERLTREIANSTNNSDGSDLETCEYEEMVESETESEFAANSY